MRTRPPRPTVFPYTTLFRSRNQLHPPKLCGSCVESTCDGQTTQFELLGNWRSFSCGGPMPFRGTLESSGAHLKTRTDHKSEWRSEEHTSELQSLRHLVCRLL